MNRAEVSEKDFILHKRNALSRADNSRKSAIDDAVLPLVSLINSLPGFYTTSSCSGRIMLIGRKSDKKNETEWLFTSHEIVKPDDVLSIVKKGLPDGAVWFRQENMILHLAAKSISLANQFIESASASGFKRSGIIYAGSRIVISVESPDRINALIARNRKLYVSEEGITALAEEANSRLKTNFSRIERLYSAVEKMR
jgi:tRNA wybutosine-synthesizing protein 3